MESRSNMLYLVVGVLIVVIALMGFYIYHQRQQQDSVELKIGNQGVSIQKN